MPDNEQTVTIRTEIPNSSGAATPPPPAYFLSLSVERFRCFKDKRSLDLSDGNGHPAQWTVILGDNGVGKTTLLRCLATVQSRVKRFKHAPFLFELFPASQNAIDYFFSYALFQEPSPRFQSQIACGITLQEGKQNSVTLNYSLEKQWTALLMSMSREDMSGLICYGYGASRQMGTASLSETLSPDTTASLFDDSLTLINAEEWLLQADYGASRGDGSGEEAGGTAARPD